MKRSKQTLVLLAAILASMLSFSSKATADIAAEILAECSAELLSIVNNCEDQMMNRASDCADRIEMLILRGRRDLAERFHKRCAKKLHAQENQCLAEIDSLTSECESLVDCKRCFVDSN